MSLLEPNPNAPAAWHGNLPITSRYTYGLAGERFFQAIKEEGRILGSQCQKCNHIYVPATIFCERCMGETEEWVDVGTVGKVHTFTLLHENYDGSYRETPEIVAFIAMGDGGLVHRLGEVQPEDVYIEMEVEAVFKAKKEREASILDILYFKPA
ncbi:MAG: Zn-ribbon domain-containing OB-fold protein [Chloroflexota bacterium]